MAGIRLIYGEKWCKWARGVDLCLNQILDGLNMLIMINFSTTTAKN